MTHEASPMHPVLQWLLHHHGAHGCLASRPLRWGVDCQVQWPKDAHLLDCDRCPDFLHGSSHGQKRPDFLVFLERQGELLVLVLELTQGRVDRHKRAQIAQGLQVLSQMLSQCGARSQLSVEVFLLHSGHIRSADVHRLRRPMPFRGKPLSPVMDRCGRLLNDLLECWPSR